MILAVERDGLMIPFLVMVYWTLYREHAYDTPEDTGMRRQAERREVSVMFEVEFCLDYHTPRVMRS